MSLTVGGPLAVASALVVMTSIAVAVPPSTTEPAAPSPVLHADVSIFPIGGNWVLNTGGRMTSWKLDGKPHLDDRFGTTLQSQARWDGKTLDAETSLGPGGAFTETYSIVQLADGKPLLQVTRTLKAFRGGHVVSVRRVYEPGS